jgi:hypothetical protein
MQASSNGLVDAKYGGDKSLSVFQWDLLTVTFQHQDRSSPGAGVVAFKQTQKSSHITLICVSWILWYGGEANNEKEKKIHIPTIHPSTHAQLP